MSQRLVRVWVSVYGVAMVTFVAYRVITVNMMTAGYADLLLVLVIASTWGLLEAAVSSIVAALAFDYFFVPPILGFAAHQIRRLDRPFQLRGDGTDRQSPVNDGATANL